ncbi:hypothetical protein K458DRAFT_491549 [Lentithecium fluviatile CBS 122367]|uniref:Glycoside hydrolase family 43 protein n=1 Tax=Lentithecium fluviatile CBS 122367 TaxID=1168545 RepID=A0A6G1IIA6_9PLEO|nr:hypothetical protein K458DRAFT_491549 [Lentithecium fluviatile CBS 122367]
MPTVHPNFPGVAAAQLGTTTYIFYHSIDDKTVWVYIIDNLNPLGGDQKRQVMVDNDFVRDQSHTSSHPLAAAAWQAENEIHLYYVNNGQRLCEAVSRDNGVTWHSTSLDGKNIYVPDGSGFYAIGSPNPTIYFVSGSSYLAEVRYNSGNWNSRELTS